MTTPPPASRGPSPLDAAQQAIDHTRRQLFPFRFERWLILGCVAFLDQCGRRSGIGGFHAPGPGGWGGGGGPNQGDASKAVEWLATHAFLVAGVAAAVLAVVIVLAALVLWLNSRGVFMYLDNVASGRADFERPWREHAAAATAATMKAWVASHSTAFERSAWSGPPPPQPPGPGTLRPPPTPR